MKNTKTKSVQSVYESNETWILSLSTLPLILNACVFLLSIWLFISSVFTLEAGYFGLPGLLLMVINIANLFALDFFSERKTKRQKHIDETLDAYVAKEKKEKRLARVRSKSFKKITFTTRNIHGDDQYYKAPSDLRDYQFTYHHVCNEDSVTPPKGATLLDTNGRQFRFNNTVLSSSDLIHSDFDINGQSAFSVTNPHTGQTEACIINELANDGLTNEYVLNTLYHAGVIEITSKVEGFGEFTIIDTDTKQVLQENNGVTNKCLPTLVYTFHFV